MFDLHFTLLPAASSLDLGEPLEGIVAPVWMHKLIEESTVKDARRQLFDNHYTGTLTHHWNYYKLIPCANRCHIFVVKGLELLK